MSFQWRWILLLVAAIVVVVSGFLLTRSGRPYGTGMLTLHKLIDLAGIALVAISVIGGLRAGGASTLDWLIVATAAILTLVTLASGGAVSASETAARGMMLVHRWAPWPLLGLLGVTFYRLAVRG